MYSTPFDIPHSDAAHQAAPTKRGSASSCILAEFARTIPLLVCHLDSLYKHLTQASKPQVYDDPISGNVRKERHATCIT